MKIILSTLVLLMFVVPVVAQQPAEARSKPIQTISAEDLVKVLRANGPKPLILQVGPQRLYQTAHIQGAEYAGMAAEPAGIQKLRERVEKLKRMTSIVIYCGCCPWEHCPNIHPAYEELRKMGFSKVKALYLPNNFKTDWHDKGYPTEAGA